MTAAPARPGLERAFDVVAHLGALEDHGMTRAGHRRVVPILGGRIHGLFDAEILPTGADWQLVRPDGAVEIDTRYSARTPEGEYVHLRTTGVRSGPPHILRALLQGESVDPSRYYFRVSVHLETAAPRLALLQQSIFIASAIRDADEVSYRPIGSPETAPSGIAGCRGTCGPARIHALDEGLIQAFNQQLNYARSKLDMVREGWSNPFIRQEAH
jgi:hypothetical protein